MQVSLYYGPLWSMTDGSSSNDSVVSENRDRVLLKKEQHRSPSPAGNDEKNMEYVWSWTAMQKRIEDVSGVIREIGIRDKC